MVKLKWGPEYRGLLMSMDSYMNLQVGQREGAAYEMVAAALAKPRRF